MTSPFSFFFMYFCNFQSFLIFFLYSPISIIASPLASPFLMASCFISESSLRISFIFSFPLSSFLQLSLYCFCCFFFPIVKCKLYQIRMQKFQELLTEAAQLKESQLKNERKNYESLPEYLKAGLNCAKKYKQLRKQDYMVQMNISEKLKKEGNRHFQADQFLEALSKYEQALAVFRFIDTKTYDNMKDEDMIYESYVLPEASREFEEQYQNHLIALYLNICSCLTKLNKKEDAIHSADQALKLKETAKAYYKKAQAYLQYINKDTADIKLGFYYLNKCYQISKDPSIVQQMHKIKKEIDQERDKEKKWFKFMFDKNSQKGEQLPAITASKTESVAEKPTTKEISKSANLKNLEKEKGQLDEREDERLQKTKEKLSKYTNKELSEAQWLESYEGEFIGKHGSKIYSIIQLYGYKEYLGQYKSLLAQCLQYRKEEANFDKRKDLYSKYFQWLKSHPIDKISKYIERYDLQTRWIRQQRSAQDKQLVQKTEETIKNTDEQKTVEEDVQLDYLNYQDQEEQVKIPKVEVVPQKKQDFHIRKTESILIDEPVSTKKAENVKNEQNKYEDKEEEAELFESQTLKKSNNHTIKIVAFLLTILVFLIIQYFS